MKPIYEKQYSPESGIVPIKTPLFSSSDININKIHYEISGICNAKCIYCPTGTGATKGKPSRFLPPVEFSRGLDRLYELNFLNADNYLGLFNWGDPLLHPQFDEILTILNERGQPYALSTNGSFVPHRITSSLLDNLTNLRISLPGFSQQSYNKIHQLNFEKVLHNIDIISELVPPNTLEINIYAYKFNIEEILEAVNYFNSKNIRFWIAMPHLMDLNVAIDYLKDTIDKEEKRKIESDLYTDHIKPLLLTRDNKNFCPYLQNELIIDEFNNILTCCVVSKNSKFYSVGSLFKLTREEIFDIKTKGQPVCQECFFEGVPYWYINNQKYLPKVLQKLNTFSYCYVDAGRGFSESEKVPCNISPSSSFTSFKVSFDLRKYSTIKSLRWNPIDSRLCNVKIKEISVETKNGEVQFIKPSALTTNGIHFSANEFRFNTNNPWFNINVKGAVSRITILGSWIVLDEIETLLNIINSLNTQIQQRDNKITNLSNELGIMKQSAVWKLLLKYQNGFVERFFPQKTRRREFYDLGFTSYRIVANEGIKSLFSYYKEKKRAINNINDSEFQNHLKIIIESLKNQDISDIIFDSPQKNLDVSIIIPVHNNIECTLKCLKSLSMNTKGSFEVVVVDDASEDTVHDELKNIQNITIIKNANNVGFIESCNRGAKQCRGKYILFLNNDTIVLERWLEPLLRVMESQDVGAAGAKLVYPDGRLQEAGAIIWDDASGHNYGRDDNPDKPEYNYVREVDYCSGAALIVRKDLFEKLGGFDGQFKPGYYEDTDLCFSFRDMGYRVMYQPMSIVIHYEGLTSGTDTHTGMKRYQEINKLKFLRKWNKVLASKHYKSDPANLFRARIRRDGKIILIIDHYVPTYDRDSGSLRMYHLLKILVDLGHKVTFIGDNLIMTEPYTTELQQFGVEILYKPFIRSIKDYLMDKGKFFDIVILSRAYIAKNHIYSVRKYCKNAKIVFDTVDLQSLRQARQAIIEGDNDILVEAEEKKQLELKLAGLSDITWVVSAFEREILCKENSSLHVEVVSNIHKIHGCKKGFAERRDIMFLGGFTHKPNVDGVKWFVETIFPKIKENIPDIVFYIVGNEPPEDIKSLNSQEIIVTGYIEDLGPYFDNCRIFVSPLRYGAGVKGKINQSMSYGLPVVTTTVGAEGLALIDGKNALIADQPEEFANKVINLYRDRTLWDELSKNSIKNVKDNFSYDMMKESLNEMIVHISG